jgi:hypothetical protein
MSVYLDMMYTLSCLFTLFTLMSVPFGYYYSIGQGYEYGPGDIPSYEVYSLGNLGYSSQKCASVPVDIMTISLSCSYGVLGEILDVGYNDISATGQSDLCANNELTQACTPTNSLV